MIKQLNTMLCSFRDCFSRKATFEWFVTIVISMMVRFDNLGVTSIIRALGLKPKYEVLDRYFRSNAWNLTEHERKWWGVVADNAPLLKNDGACVLVGDGIKISKEGRRMPGVKRLHQESENSAKAANITGQMYGCVGVLAETDNKTFCLPLACEMQDGVKEIMSWTEVPGIRQASHTVELISLAHHMTKELPNAK
jgi:hypothetical protein